MKPSSLPRPSMSTIQLYTIILSSTICHLLEIFCCFSHVSHVDWRLAGRSVMEVQVELDEDKTFYSNGDVVAGDIVLYAESAVRISRIVVTLSGVAISRTESGKNSEVHQVYILLWGSHHQQPRWNMFNTLQLLQKSQNIFPTDGLTGRSAHKGVAINKGYHVFPFAITVCLRVCSFPLSG